MRRRIPGAVGQAHPVVGNAGHVLQEDAGDELAETILRWLGSLR